MRLSLRLPPWPSSTLSIIIVSLFLSATTIRSQPQNIEVFLPDTLSPPPTPFSSPLNPPTTRSSNSNKKAIGIAVGVTAVTTLLVVSVIFLLISRCRKKRRVQPKQNRYFESVVKNTDNNNRPEPIDGGGVEQANAVVGSAAYRFGKFEGNLKGLIVDENGLDVVYWRKLEGMSSKNSFKKEVFKKASEVDDKQLRLSCKMSRRKETVQEIPLLRGKSSTSHIPLSPDSNEIGQFSPISKFESLEIERQESITIRSPPHPTSPPPVMMSVPKKQTPAPPPLPPAKNAIKPPTTLPPAKTEDAGTSSSSLSAVKMKPLHRDKVNANVEHSMEWDKIDKGSFSFDGDMMEALFGYVATNRKSPKSKPLSESQH